jgi:hypothetical protein
MTYLTYPFTGSFSIYLFFSTMKEKNNNNNNNTYCIKNRGGEGNKYQPDPNKYLTNI